MKSSKKFFYDLNKKGEYQILTHIMHFIEPQRHKRHHFINIMAYKVIIFIDEQRKQQNKYGTTRAMISTVTNKEVF